MKAFVKKNILQWHRDQRDRSAKRAKDDTLTTSQREEAERSAVRHAATIKELSA